MARPMVAACFAPRQPEAAGPFPGSAADAGFVHGRQRAGRGGAGVCLTGVSGANVCLAAPVRQHCRCACNGAGFGSSRKIAVFGFGGYCSAMVCGAGGGAVGMHAPGEREGKSVGDCGGLAAPAARWGESMGWGGGVSNRSVAALRASPARLEARLKPAGIFMDADGKVGHGGWAAARRTRGRTHPCRVPCCVQGRNGEPGEGSPKSDEAVWLGTARPPVRGACEELGLLAGMQLSR